MHKRRLQNASLSSIFLERARLGVWSAAVLAALDVGRTPFVRLAALEFKR
jgi:hypothetical protein